MRVFGDGELRGVLSAEFGRAAGGGETQEADMPAIVFPENGSLSHPLSWKSHSFTSGKEEINKHGVLRSCHNGPKHW